MISELPRLSQQMFTSVVWTHERLRSRFRSHSRNPGMGGVARFTQMLLFVMMGLWLHVFCKGWGSMKILFHSLHHHCGPLIRASVPPGFTIVHDQQSSAIVVSVYPSIVRPTISDISMQGLNIWYDWSSIIVISRDYHQSFIDILNHRNGFSLLAIINRY